jgi:hypothetical protein
MRFKAIFLGFGILFIDIWYDSLDGGLAQRKASTYTVQKNWRRIHVPRGIQIHDPSVQGTEDKEGLRPYGNYDPKRCAAIYRCTVLL